MLNILKHRFTAGAALAALALVTFGWTTHADDKAAKEETPNIYLAREGLSPEQLLDFIDRMKSKPKSIRSRPGFALAIMDAADRILASDADAATKSVAVIEKLTQLHERACQGDTAADGELAELAVSLPAAATCAWRRLL